MHTPYCVNLLVLREEYLFLNDSFLLTKSGTGYFSLLFLLCIYV